MATVIRPTERLRQAMAQLNAARADKLAPVLQRVAARLHTDSPEPFETHELAQLPAVLELPAEALEELLAALNYVFDQATFTVAAPARLAEDLVACALEPARVRRVLRASRSGRRSCWRGSGRQRGPAR
jgi:hypothetical protein